MEYFFSSVILLVLELIYFKVADKFNIIDKPNERSSHSEITLRGGGIIFYFSILLYLIINGFNHVYFFVGLTLIALISFLDDLYTLSSKIRVFIHIAACSLMFYELSIFNLPWVYIMLIYIFVIGIINAYNFMDGINGITVCYSISILILFIILNIEKNFIDKSFLVYVLIGVLIFGFFNFRQKAKAFAGDVGSVSIAFIIIYILSLLIIQTQNFIYILILLVYGVDTICTIVCRLANRKNIFNAHREHLYQLLSNELRCNKLLVGFSYGLIQFLIGLIIIYIVRFPFIVQLYFSILIIILFIIMYFVIRKIILNKMMKY